MPVTLCQVEDIPEAGSRGFALPQANLFAVKKRGVIYLYLNRCPHLGLPLEWEKDVFLDTEAQFIKCFNHGAFFVPESGECIQGPCRGEALWQVDYRIENGMVLIPEEELPARLSPT